MINNYGSNSSVFSKLGWTSIESEDNKSLVKLSAEMDSISEVFV